MLSSVASSATHHISLQSSIFNSFSVFYFHVRAAATSCVCVIFFCFASFPLELMKNFMFCVYLTSQNIHTKHLGIRAMPCLRSLQSMSSLWYLTSCGVPVSPSTISQPVSWSNHSECLRMNTFVWFGCHWQRRRLPKFITHINFWLVQFSSLMLFFHSLSGNLNDEFPITTHQRSFEIHKTTRVDSIVSNIETANNKAIGALNGHCMRTQHLYNIMYVRFRFFRSRSRSSRDAFPLNRLPHKNFLRHL